MRQSWSQYCSVKEQTPFVLFKKPERNTQPYCSTIITKKTVLSAIMPQPIAPQCGSVSPSPPCEARLASVSLSERRISAR